MTDRSRVVWAMCLAIVSAACAKRAEEGASAGAQPAVSARTTIVASGPFTETISTIGVVVPRSGHVASLSAPAPTRIARVFVSTGQRVARGDSLVEFEQAGFEASASSAEAALSGAQQAYDRAVRLSQAGIVPRKELDQATTDLARARAEVVMARRSRELSVLRAPIGGVVTRMAAVLGASADANQPLVEIADPAALDILLNVTPSDAGRVRPGASVTLSAGQNADGEPLGTGRIFDVGGVVDSASRAVAIRVQVPATTRPLRIGETVSGQIVVAVKPVAIAVPLEALVPEGEGYKVFVVDQAGLAHGRPVEVGGRTARVAEITKGLAAGERIVTFGAYGIEDGTRIVEAKQ